ncbi:toll/interleukin-1 receptor domain-containing protein [Terricaulis silvestris]|uniref:toll/interleukin-1 receptor domain-containing protein n=1 Tax=Terricaulis silvestris TaxID=2686094 RepID=UPI00131AD834|nr:toll/interleukin-1 receptor domain-containing protein [Terricaulis silvestris]
MADIFIACSRLDLDRVKPVTDRLNSLGYSVWCDSAAALAHPDEVDRELEAAKAILAVWSVNAANTVSVIAQASDALDAGKLLQVRIDASPPPQPFHTIATADVSGGEWGVLEDALKRLVRNGEAPSHETRAPGLLAHTPAAGAPLLLTIALVAVLAAFSGAVTATFNDVMSVAQLQIALIGMLGVAGACAALVVHRYTTLTRAEGG